MRSLRFAGIIFLVFLIVANAAVFGARHIIMPTVKTAQTYVEPTAAPEEIVPAAVTAEVTPAPTPVPTAEPTPEPTATPEPTPAPDSPAGRAITLGLPAPPDIDVSSWEYTLVNGDHSIDRYEPEQLAYLDMTLAATDISFTPNGNRCAVDARIAQPLIDMCLACKQAGLPVFLSSGYRSYNEQAQNFQRICQNNGITDGKDVNGHYITMPAGCSEHQLALCCDITDVYHPIKNDSIAQVPTVQWLGEHCSEYGFILRFPADKRDITKVMSESWHFRYVGQAAAEYITANNLCLEEFLALYGVN